VNSIFASQSLSSNSQAVWVALLWGLATSLHCLGMCGGFALSEKAREAARTHGRWRASVAYHLGRFLTYTGAGVVCGWVGQGLALSPGLQVAVPLVGGLFLLFWGLQGSGLVPGLRQVRLPQPRFLNRFALRGDLGPFSVGALSILLPCAPLQIALQSYCADHGDRWPRFTTNRRFRARPKKGDDAAGVFGFGVGVQDGVALLL